MSGRFVRAIRVLQTLRGGSQARLMEAEDGKVYVVKFRNNPQGTRTLVNEWIGSQLLRHCAISSPRLSPLELTPSILQMNPELSFQVGKRKLPIEPGIHLGSECPVNPAQTGIYDFLPSRLLSCVHNSQDFTRIFVLDHLFGQADTRQAIFTREQCKSPKGCYRAWMIDQGLLFGGATWQIRDLPLQGLYRDQTVYLTPRLDTLIEDVISRLHALDLGTLKSVAEEVTGPWLSSGDRSELNHLLQSVDLRIKRADEIISFHKMALATIFPKSKTSDLVTLSYHPLYGTQLAPSYNLA